MTNLLDDLHGMAVAADTAGLGEEFLAHRQKVWDDWLEAMDPSTFLRLEPVLRAAVALERMRNVDALDALNKAVREAGL